MSYANWKEWIDDQTINAALVNGAGRELDDCVIGIGADGTGTGPLYLDGNTLKSYIFGGLVNGYYGELAPVSDFGAGSAGVNYVHLAYVETSDAGVEGHAPGSISSVAFSLVLHTTTNTPSGYQGSMVLGYATDAIGDNTWTLLTAHDLPPTFIRRLVAPTMKTDTLDEKTTDVGVTVEGVLIKDSEVDGRGVAADGVDLDDICDVTALFAASDTPAELLVMGGAAAFNDVSTWRHLNDWDGGELVEGWTLLGAASALALVIVTATFTAAADT